MPEPSHASSRVAQCSVAAFVAFLFSFANLASGARAQETEPASPVAPVAADQVVTPLPTLEQLETQGAVVGDIRIVNGNVFDTNDRREDRALFHFANALHTRTRQEVIRRQLLFGPGDRLSTRLIRESERILRQDSYLYDATVVPVRYENGRVDLEVRTRDVWTLKPGIGFGRSGGQSSTRFELEESNLLGWGKEITLSHDSDVDRSSTLIRYTDPQVFGTWIGLVAGYSLNSDGRQRELAITRPFYALDSRWAAGGALLEENRIDARYNLGHIVDKFQHDQQKVQLFGGRSNGIQNGWVQRLTYGMEYESDSFASVPDPLSAAVLPEARKLVYPFVGYDWVQDRFETRRNQSQIGRTEDIFTGTFMRTLLGYATPLLGSDRDAMILALQGGRSLESLDVTRTLLLSAEAAGRIEKGTLRNASLQSDARFYWRASERQLFFGAFTGVITRNLDAEQQLLLGGEEPGLRNPVLEGPGLRAPLIRPDTVSLRGYPLRYQDGSAMALLTIEHRYYTPYYLFNILYVGAATFVDVGRTWGRGTSGAAGGELLKDVGLGLRFANSRSSFGNVIHIDLAFPLGPPRGIDKVQFIVETKKSF